MVRDHLSICHHRSSLVSLPLGDLLSRFSALSSTILTPKSCQQHCTRTERIGLAPMADRNRDRRRCRLCHREHL